MSLDGLIDPGAGRGENPRNAWSRLRQALEIAQSPGLPERWHLAQRILESVRYAADLSDAVFDVYARQLEALRPAGLPPAPVNSPADYLGHAAPIHHRAFRRLDSKVDHPSPFPYGLVLPMIVGGQNDITFLYDAATALGAAGPVRTPVIHILLDANRLRGPRELALLLQDLAAQTHDGPVRLTLFGGAGDLPLAAPSGAPVPDRVEADLLSEEAQGHIAARLDAADIALFLSGSARLDATALARIAWPGRISQTLVQLLKPLGEDDGQKITPFSLTALRPMLTMRYPFRDVAGLNMAVPAALLRLTGLLDPRFTSRHAAGRELAFRLYNHGAWFAPLALPGLTRDKDEISEEDARLYTGLAPNHWDRKKDAAHYEVPKVSVYIPTYNASKYIERAVDSVLEQDFLDLEVCLANDGSYDRTLEVLERRYGDERRVRWLANPNGGIGFASNTAIGMARGLYIGQLDSDDRLKPGAVRRLAEHLDANPAVVCAYGSCERVDAEGNYLQDEYSWPVFSREKMMVTSIAHHFRMFRRAAWERTSGFREDIVNAVDYDIFLKLSETGNFHHVEEMLYQRRWHGENTSNVNEHHQTANTYRVQTEALKRLGLERFWEVAVVEGQDDPRRVTYRRKPGQPMVVFWPDYSRSNPYQKLLYGAAREEAEFVAGDIDAALRLMTDLPALGGTEGPLTFHLHWLNFLFVGLGEGDAEEARARVDGFLERLTLFKSMGGRLVWTIHNVVSHDSPFIALETELSEAIVALADTLHLHSEASVAEVETAFTLDHAKIVISRHGAYVGAYPDFIGRDQARDLLGYGRDEDIILFTGQIRPYKGVEHLVDAMRTILADRPRARLVLAGAMQVDLFETLSPALTAAERARIDVTGRFLDDMEMQVFFRAADIAVYPYRKVLTSGSLLLALSFGVPVVVPDVGMTREVLGSGPGPAGRLYAGEAAELEAAIRDLLSEKEAGRLQEMGTNARAIAEATNWPDFGKVVLG
ncbi:glycosyltransferase [Ponticoccus sp. SC2-23]|uniref:glycosyltransferase n=1 Tax=Alexandriicola marinus TaxID=2081710 RepID=UPI000FDB97C3|nr:glycosyltransferase [Alexandriicola marinus]MBM1222450.1 glycosyltransferase [Ponticoccus sp. SC6-9]MBM1226956.1 glycosyltransferase [Ponticoccus sp. SC6-15]MBM1231377.1 glycosyltransferase [Ponticoccus sp. SC6-38]MBM1235950.1 glycosyltransferase [Ponticoccus sp. SC6-45]MBM1240400.1 glycosyltransferase [Ponticoccus sp. SC6-49]MBM1244935.1 glycosyltransferase [Ponticoccus sp. SC2-64]MBM1249424.1 glycosyltransferase [Ponticoccus sp. SC6-42]MBM1253893.1 glycosyltransferase [Ponticoccus sp. 